MNLQGVNHYENFPVASWLCPPALRAPITAIYHFARTADDIADEGNATPQDRLNALERYRQQLDLAVQAKPVHEWPQVFEPLAAQIRQHALPRYWLHALLDAFEQDVRYTSQAHHYASYEELLNYCHRSANPVGRLLLHLYGVSDDTSLEQSDDICSALQLINFWQDLSTDLPRGRYYLPQHALAIHGLTLTDFAPHDGLSGPKAQAAEQLVLDLCAHARKLMLQGAPLALRLPGRMGWELRLVVQGGLHILHQIETLQGRSWQTRPRLQASHLPSLLWRAWRMPGVKKGLF
jgi:squalene synthase HpnC